MRRGKFKSIKRVLYCTLPIFFLAKYVEGISSETIYYGNQRTLGQGNDAFRNIFPQIFFDKKRKFYEINAFIFTIH